MFIAVYEFEIKAGTEAEFRKAWLEVTKVIYQQCGSFGSRLHTSDDSNILVGYAQWPDREQWKKDHELTDCPLSCGPSENERLSCSVKDRLKAGSE
ncbi:antibiotic biosynthesis monooxygenase family protein [Endozoicomonas atrinae]|uniref:antibiotic biosynthesis monooxygenase family protein n=1 Tax=Endozoicomonas atrinae TaxID=1333660 RepID=UPI003B0093C6